MGKVFIDTYGCQMNVLDSELIRSKLAAQGYESVSDKGEADLILLNTCSVRERAEDRAVSNAGMLRKLKEARPELVVGIVGCMAQNRQDRLTCSIGPPIEGPSRRHGEADHEDG